MNCYTIHGAAKDPSRKMRESTPGNKELKLRFGIVNPPTFAFIMDIASKRNKGIPLSDLQETYVSIIERIARLSTECLSSLPRDHDWFFVFELVNEFSLGIAHNVEGYNIEDHNDNLRFLVTIYNCCACVHPWRPRRLLDWLLTTGGWEERIRRLLYEHPLKEHQVRLTLNEIMHEIKRLVTFVNDLQFG